MTETITQQAIEDKIKNTILDSLDQRAAKNRQTHGEAYSARAYGYTTRNKDYQRWVTEQVNLGYTDVDIDITQITQSGNFPPYMKMRYVTVRNIHTNRSIYINDIRPCVNPRDLKKSEFLHCLEADKTVAAKLERDELRARVTEFEAKYEAKYEAKDEDEYEDEDE